jgi:hypothetical protein
VRRLVVSNTWVYGDIMDLDIRPEASGVMLRLLGEPNHPHILESSCDLTSWIPLITNAPDNSVFEFLDTNSTVVPRQFYRGVKP